ncbi:MAG TPA: TMEM165/GDT1 family protein [Patescibacteria group bacterium]|nr:TMEM165/GDT1 family protein [Patescibacteria group bacterium]
MNWKVFFIAFGTLFLAELGDKTQLAVFTLVATHKDPLSVFLGASIALVLVTLIGAVFGQFVTRYIPTNYLQLAAGILFVGIGIFVLKDSLPAIMKEISK